MLTIRNYTIKLPVFLTWVEHPNSMWGSSYQQSVESHRNRVTVRIELNQTIDCFAVSPLMLLAKMLEVRAEHCPP